MNFIKFILGTLLVLGVFQQGIYASTDIKDEPNKTPLTSVPPEKGNVSVSPAQKTGLENALSGNAEADTKSSSGWHRQWKSKKGFQIDRCDSGSLACWSPEEIALVRQATEKADKIFRKKKNIALVHVGMIIQTEDGNKSTYRDVLLPIIFLSGQGDASKPCNNKTKTTKGQKLMESLSSELEKVSKEKFDLIQIASYDQQPAATTNYLRAILPKDRSNQIKTGEQDFYDSEQAAIRTIIRIHPAVQNTIDTIIKNNLNAVFKYLYPDLKSDASLEKVRVTMVMNTLSTRSSCSLLKKDKDFWGCTETLAYLSSKPEILWQSTWNHLLKAHRLKSNPKCLNAVTSIIPDSSNKDEEGERTSQAGTLDQLIPHPHTSLSVFIMYHHLIGYEAPK